MTELVFIGRRGVSDNKHLLRNQVNKAISTPPKDSGGGVFSTMTTTKKEGMSNFQALITYLVIVLGACYFYFDNSNSASAKEEEKEGVKYEGTERVYEDANNMMRLALIQPAGAIKNLGDKKGIFLPGYLSNLQATAAFPEGAPADYPAFEQRILDYYQPKDKVCGKKMSEEDCRKKRIEGAVKIIGYSALGKYQTLLVHHGKRMDGWMDPRTQKAYNWTDATPEEKLIILHIFLSGEPLQRRVCTNLCNDLKVKYEGGPQAMGGGYYSGTGGNVIYKITSGSFVDKAWYIIRHPIKVGKMYIKQGKFGNIKDYSDDVLGCYKRKNNDKGVVETDEDMELFVDCIGWKETGFLAKKKGGDK